ncbi:MAG: formate dehydrogenase [Candidatus Meridianibacter frigidus]|nr:MAG: formate dehydrogenase [Candidatus Eremiobacteraeota bacterium]
MPGLGTSFGRGGATTFVQDLKNSDCILIEGSNFAECHPVAFRFVMQAKERGAKIIHVDPRFTRTSALADTYVPIRSGTDIVFLGAIINWVLRNERYFKEYVQHYTNASSILTEEFRDTEDLEGLFSGFNESARSGGGGSAQSHEGASQSRGEAAPGGGYDTQSWQFEEEEVPRFDGTGTASVVRRDPSLQHERCVFQVLRRHFARYDAQMVQDVCGTPRALFEEVCEALASNSGRERTAAIAYAVGWTQHTVGVQYIRTAAILQLLLGNVGRPGGGIMALRGHANIQGATDIPTLYDLLPGYLPMPAIQRDEQDLASYLKSNAKPTGWWANLPKYMVSLLKAFYGDAATKENGYCFDYLPQLTGDHSMIPTQVAMKDGEVKGYFVIGQNPAASGLNAELGRAAMERLEWMVNLDSYETDTASFWRREGADPAKIPTECFFIPAATVLEKDGTLTNTNRLLQFHEKAVEPAGASRSDLSFIYQLGLRLKECYKTSTDPKDRPILDMTWAYAHEDERERSRGEPSALAVMQEINGYRVSSGEQVSGFTELQEDGSTACGGWIYSGVCPDKQTHRARNREADDYTSPDWGFSWPANRRMLYNRASADPAGKPWSEAKKYVWWDERGQEWTGYDVPDFPLTKAPDTPAKPGATGMDAHSGSDPFIMQLDGRGAIFVSSTLKDGPLPTHYEPLNSLVPNALYKQQHNPVMCEWKRRDNPYNGVANEDYPYILTTYRLTEHSGIMTKYVPWLAELQPALFAEIDPELAVARNLKNGDWVTIRTAVGEIEARALVSGRIQPLRLAKGRWVHQIGLPYNYAPLGLAHGDSSGDLVPLVMDPNVSIHEAKTLTCNIRAGRRNKRKRSHVDEDVPAAQRSQEGAPTAHGRDFPGPQR